MKNFAIKSWAGKMKLLMFDVVIFTTLLGTGGGGWLLVTRPARAAEVSVAESLKFYAINPGYTVGGVGNVGEVIVLKNVRGGSVSLAGFSINYINSSGNASLLLEFPANSEMIGEDLQLRLTSGGAADLSYSKTLAFKGAVELLWNGEVVDRVCWNGGEGCYAAFSSAKPTVLVRDMSSMAFEARRVEDFEITYDEGWPSVRYEEGMGGDDGGGEDITAHCAGLRFSELLSYYENEAAEQFIEIYNGGDEQILMDGCSVGYKSKRYGLAGILKPGEYYAYRPAGFTLTKNPTSSNEILLVDADGSVVDRLAYYNGQHKGVALAQFGYDETGAEVWLATFAPTPGEENNYQKYKTCEAGKVINEETGNCVKASTLDTTLAACPEGKYRNPLTGRCKSYPSTSSSALKECAEGYERNPETGRCRKIKTNTGAEYGLESGEAEMTVNFVALWGIIGVAGVGAGYVGWQFRKEIGEAVGKLWAKVRRK